MGSGGTDLTGRSASDLSRAIAARQVAPSEVMAACLARIAAANPAVNAIVALRDPDALMAEARAADDAKPDGWLHGIPFAIKDLQNVAGIRSTFGFAGLAAFVPRADDPLPRRIRGAGAILIGKTNVPEFGLGSHSFNPVHGVTVNPYDLTRAAGGSSGGAAAALACRMVPLADGSDMMGSLRNPAAFCNVYGFRPTWGLVPGDPGGDAPDQLATDGPMARCPEDLARLLDTLCAPAPGAKPRDPFTTALDMDVTGLRIGWLGGWGGAYATEPGILDLCETALRVFEQLGCVVAPVDAPFPAERLWDSWTVLRSVAVAAGLAEIWARPDWRALLKPEARWEIERGLAMPGEKVDRARATRAAWRATLAALFERFDALVLPSAQVWPFPKDWRHPRSVDGRVMDTYHRWMEVVIPVSLVGLPALAAPAGFGPQSLPMGFQVFGPSGSDRALLRLGQAYHRATDWPGRRPPPGVAAASG